MDTRISVRDVFKSLGQPTTTYVKQDEGKYEKTLLSGLEAKGKLCLLTGPSKTGKTTLYTKVLSDEGLTPLRIRCHASVTASEFWKRALEQVDFERISSFQRNSSERVSGSGKIGGKIGWAWLAGLLGEVSVGVESSMGELAIREKILSQPSPDHLIPILKNLPIVLVVEDFHYLEPDVKKNVFQQWKVFVDSEVSVIIVGTTHHAVDLALANKDLVGRISQVDLPGWMVTDLEKIGVQGFSFLGMEVDKRMLRIVADEAAGLPIIMQDTCYQLLANKGIREVDQKKSGLEIGKAEVYRALHDVAIENYAQFEAIYEQLVTGPRKRARKYDTYELVLSTFTHNPVAFSLKRYEIEERLQGMDIPKEKIPPAASVDSMLKALAKFQQDREIQLLEWNENVQRLYILEPSFLFYLRWREQRESPASLVELFLKLLQGDVHQGKRK